MATVRPVLWKHKRNRQGHHPLWIRFDDGARTLYHSLGVTLHPRHWNERKERVRKSYTLHKDVNELIEARLADAERERLRLLTAREVPTAKALKAAVAGIERVGCFLVFAREFLDGVEAQGNIGRVRKERAVLRKLEAFGGSPLPFAKLRPVFLDEWTAWLMTEKKNKASTVQCAMRIVRLHYNRAVRHGVVKATHSPFHSYKPPKVTRTARAKLTAEQVAAIEALDLGPAGPSGSARAKVRDWFLFSLYAQGARFADVMQLRRSNIARVEEEGVVSYRLRYEMGKTGKVNDVLLIPQALAILDPYLTRETPEADDPYLFDALDRYDTSTPKGLHDALSSRNAYANKELREIATRAKIESHVSFHVARHSFADLARKAGWSVYDVSRALRHSSIQITDGYLAGFDVSALDARMRGLFDPST